jgi:hypothetical protein
MQNQNKAQLAESEELVIWLYRSSQQKRILSNSTKPKVQNLQFFHHSIQLGAYNPVPATVLKYNQS